MTRKCTAVDVSNSHPFAGGPHVMGVVNVTPDSFSDGGKFLNPDKAIVHGLQMVSEGARILDVGGESSRPGAEPIDVEEEIARIVPVIEGLVGKVPWVSIDTRNAKTMEAALKAGANIINDISALSYDPDSLSVAAGAGVPIFLMHMQGSPRTMQKKPLYHNVVEDVYQYLQQRIELCETHRIDVEMLVCDPGIGFGKTLEHNLLLLRNIKEFHGLGVPILLGTSRKSFIGKISNDEPPDDRLAGSLASALYGYSQGVQIFRVHDVAAHVQAFKVFDAIQNVQGAES
ncbi:MAG: dihydropteroate synthase [Alphaproteobacteria bacterium]|nr:dihydropteroate synthase [Alphaproteobacteria bacterium]